MMLSCKEVAELVSQGLDRRLGWWEVVKVRVHLAMCGVCRAYRRQVEGLARLFRSRFAGGDGMQADHEASMKCSEEAKTRITEVLRRQITQSN